MTMRCVPHLLVSVVVVAALLLGNRACGAEDVEAIMEGLDKSCPETEKQRKFDLDQCKNCKNPQGCHCGGGLFRQPLTAEQEAEEKKTDSLVTDYRETLFEQASGETLPPHASSHPPNEEVLIAGGTFQMGTDRHILMHMADGEGPARMVTVDGFYIDKYEVSNGEFHKFVDEHNYRTEAEQFGNSFVMDYFLSKEVNDEIDQVVQAAPWWLPVKGANWRRPEGRGSGIEERMNHPVVHVSWNDAASFCRAHGKRLPTEAEWEMACRGGKKDRLYPWGNNLTPRGEVKLNIWTGQFPKTNNASDGYAGTCPVDRFVQNDYGLHSMVGNVWEWTQDWHTTQHANQHQANPQGATMSETKVKKGGSFMCTQATCYMFRCAARSHISADSSAHNVGFRCVRPIGQEERPKDEL